MMIFRVHGSEYGKHFEVSFFHSIDESVKRQFTEVALEAENREYVTLFGKAICRPGDQFNHAQGRKIALQRAIRFLPRKLRRQIWNEYWRSIGQNRRVREV